MTKFYVVKDYGKVTNLNLPTDGWFTLKTVRNEKKEDVTKKISCDEMFNENNEELLKDYLLTSLNVKDEIEIEYVDW